MTRSVSRTPHPPSDQNHAVESSNRNLPTQWNSESDLRAVLDNTHRAYLLLDRDGKILLLNKTAQQLFRDFYSYDCAPGDPLQFIAEKMNDFDYGFHFRSVLDGNWLTYQKPLIREDGSECWFEFHYEPVLDNNNHVARVVISATDITEQKQSDFERQRLRERLLSLQKTESLRTLAGGIAHDFNNLLGGILGFAELSMLSLSESSPVYDYMKKIETATHRAAALSKSLLAFSGHGKFNVQSIEVNDTIENLLLTLIAAVKGKCSISFVPHSVPLSIDADVQQFSQLLLNLVLNAAEAYQDDEKGSITITTGLISFDDNLRLACQFDSDALQGEAIAIEICDDGIGIDQETLLKIFDPFFSTKQFGRGLGLAAVQGIIRSHSGAAKIETAPNLGTKFSIYLPRSSAAISERIDYTTAISEETYTILVIDDDESLLTIERSILEKAGYDVISANDGIKAIDALRENRDRISLAVLDVTMPIMSGEVVLEHLLTIKEDLKVIVTSGFGEADIAAKFIRHKPTVFLPKPFSFEQLVSSINNLLNQDPKSEKLIANESML